MTTYNDTLRSLAILCNTSADNVLSFLGESNNNIHDFLLRFKLDDKTLLDTKIELVSLHSTTSSDNCHSFRKMGLLNLQSALTQKTPLNSYLNKKEVKINIVKKFVSFKNCKIDLNNHSTYTPEMDPIRHKLYDDYQINGFLYSNELLSYGGRTKSRPEILFNLANLLGDFSIETDWESTNENKHYIIKYKQPLQSHTWYTFDFELEDRINIFGLKEDSKDYLTTEQIDLEMKKWVIQNSLLILKDEIDYSFSYISPGLDIDPSDIICFMTEKDYLSSFKTR